MNLLNVITFTKKSPEKLISWFFLAVFILLGSYLAISWPRRKAILFFPEQIMVPEISRVAEAVVAVDFEDFLTRKPITYYHDLIQRNPFVRPPGVVGRLRDDGIIVGQERLVYRGHMLTPEGPIAFIEGRETHMVREEDEIEGWRIIWIDREEVKIYNERKGQELLLPLGGGPEEKERLRREREERQRYWRGDIRFERMPPGERRR